MEYNSLEKDIKTEKVELEQALEILKSLNKKWLYIKINICKDTDPNGWTDYVSYYNKFRVSSIDVDVHSEQIFIYGSEDKDRCMISLSDIVQSEYSEKDMLLIFKLVDDYNFTEIAIQSFVPNKERTVQEIITKKRNLVITEGKTDWKHLKAALNSFNSIGLYQELDFEFLEYENDISMNENTIFKDKGMGYDTLDTLCKYTSFFENEYKRIFVFDADVEKINKFYRDEKGYFYLGNNVYAIVLPIPEFRKDTPLISIENYYKDEEIKTPDIEGKRLYLSGEFTIDGFFNGEVYAVKANPEKPNLVIDQEVYYKSEEFSIKNKSDLNKNIENLKKVRVLSKNQFAENILNNVKPFDSISKENFKIFFDLLREVLKDRTNTPEELIPLSNNIYVEKYDDHIDLNIKILFEEESYLEELRNNLRTTSLGFEENKVLFFIGVLNEWEVCIARLEHSKGLEDFIEKKLENSFNNRVYLHCFNPHGEYVCSFEMFDGESGEMQFYRLIQLVEYQVNKLD